MNKVKKVIKYITPEKFLAIYRAFHEIKSIYKRTRPLYPRKCSICEYEGYFGDAGKPPRIDARCPSCGCLERHRLFWLWFNKNKHSIKQPILHFAPEKILEARLRPEFESYKTADLFMDADIQLNIESIELESNSVSTVICNHVLEHVDDKLALKEINRILVPGGLLLTSVPIIEAWASTYENSVISIPLEREVHFGQDDHVRYYGHDFRQRLIDAGFESVDEFTAKDNMVIEYGLIRGEKIFIYRKSFEVDAKTE